jgi:hypothetical protein
VSIQDDRDRTGWLVRQYAEGIGDRGRGHHLRSESEPLPCDGTAREYGAAETTTQASHRSASARARLTPKCRPCHANARCSRLGRDDQYACGSLPSRSKRRARQPALGEALDSRARRRAERAQGNSSKAPTSLWGRLKATKRSDIIHTIT